MRYPSDCALDLVARPNLLPPSVAGLPTRRGLRRRGRGRGSGASRLTSVAVTARVGAQPGHVCGSEEAAAHVLPDAPPLTGEAKATMQPTESYSPAQALGSGNASAVASALQRWWALTAPPEPPPGGSFAAREVGRRARLVSVLLLALLLVELGSAYQYFIVDTDHPIMK